MERSTRIVPLGLALAASVVLAAGCGGGGTTAQRTLTERERDSTLGASAVPGGAAVTRTLATSDSMAARAARQDAATEATPH